MPQSLTAWFLQSTYQGLKNKMTHPPAQSYKVIPKEHPFYAFLKNLPCDEICDARPDVVDVASKHRAMIMFLGVNSSARLSRFISEFKRNATTHYCHLLSQKVKGDSAMCIVYLTEKVDGGHKIIQFPLPFDLSERPLFCPVPPAGRNAPREEPDIKPTNNPMPGVKLMPTY